MSRDQTHSSFSFTTDDVRRAFEAAREAIGSLDELEPASSVVIDLSAFDAEPPVFFSQSYTKTSAVRE